MKTICSQLEIDGLLLHNPAWGCHKSLHGNAYTQTNIQAHSSAI